MPNYPICDKDDCKKFNISTSFVTRDAGGIRVFCDEHWQIICKFFIYVAACSRRDVGCRRNHLADFYSEDRTIFSIRHDGKYWELCKTHISIYEKLVSAWLVD